MRPKLPKRIKLLIAWAHRNPLLAIRLLILLVTALAIVQTLVDSGGCDDYMPILDLLLRGLESLVSQNDYNGACL